MEAYLKERQKYLHKDDLSKKEKQADTLLKSLLHTIDINKIVKGEQDKNDLVKYFKLMPKGANLHCHFSTLVPSKR